MIKKESKPLHQKVVELIATELVPAGTGALKEFLSDPSNLVQRFSNLVQSSQKEKFFHAFGKEWEELVASGKLNEDFLKSETGAECLQEMLDYLDEEKPDQKKFNAMKKIFFAATSVSTEGKDISKVHQLMKLCRELSSTEIIILGAAYKGYLKNRNDPNSPHWGPEDWSGAVADFSDALSQGMVDRYEQPLIDKRIIADRINTDRSGIGKRASFRLMSLGIELGGLLSS